MSERRLSEVEPRAYAALMRVIAEVSGEDARSLEMQAVCATVTKNIRARMIDLQVHSGAPCVYESGPLPARGAVVPAGGELVGELIIWIREGWLSGIEQAWFTDEPPGDWPSPDELTFQ